MFCKVKGVKYNFIKYKGLFKQLVSRDIKLKYRRSILGYLWSILNPLLTMLILTIVFSRFFKFSIDNFPVYLLCGNVIFGFFSAATNQSCSSIISNGSLIKKTYVPKEIFVFSKVTSCFVEYGFSLAALLLVMLITKTRFSVYNLLFVIPSVEVFVFSLGFGLFLAQANVFFRDTQYLYGVFLTALNYLTPLFYPIDILPNNVKYFVVNFNPLYTYVDMFRQCVYRGQPITPYSIFIGASWSLGALLLGIIIFKAKQDKFILYI